MSAQGWLREGQLRQRPSADFGGARRLVVVAAHDDDLVGLGATIARASARGLPVRLLTACPGPSENSSDCSDPSRRSRMQALTDLGVPWPKVLCLGLAVDQLAERERTLTEVLRRTLLRGDLVVTTWWHDGCPDHEVVGRAARLAAATHSLTIWGAAVWMWHWARPTNPVIPWSRVRVLWPTPHERELKESALRTQRTARPGAGPDDRILEPVRLRRALDLPELFVETDKRG